MKDKIAENLVIAAYMEWVLSGYERPYLFFGKKRAYYKHPRLSAMPFEETFKYDESWDWLIPVWRKAWIESQRIAAKEDSPNRHLKAVDEFEYAIHNNSISLAHTVVYRLIRFIDVYKQST